jgi:hypothetical protein
VAAPLAAGALEFKPASPKSAPPRVGPPSAGLFFEEVDRKRLRFEASTATPQARGGFRELTTEALADSGGAAAVLAEQRV